MRAGIFNVRMRLSPWVAAAVALGLAGCGRPAVTSSAAPAMPVFTVVSADAGARTLTLRGDQLPAPGADGTQVVHVAAGDAAIGYSGRQVRGELAREGAGWRLDRVWPADPRDEALAAEAARRLRHESAALGRQAHRDVGDPVPDFALYNQDGRLVQTTALRGRRFVLNFIFTRCAQPEMCPAASRRMAALQQAAAAAGLDDVSFVTISFDPGADTPGVLRDYAAAYGLDLRNYQLLTGPAAQIDELTRQFGILRRTEDGVLQHTMATLLVSPEGRIVFRREGSNWRPEEFLERLAPAAPTTGATSATTPPAAAANPG